MFLSPLAKKELVFSHKTVYDGPITPSEELAGGRFWTLDEIRAIWEKIFLHPTSKTSSVNWASETSFHKKGQILDLYQRICPFSVYFDLISIQQKTKARNFVL